MFKEFQKFILRGNLVDLAIGFTVGTAFSTVARSLVDDIIMPPISVLLGGKDFSNKSITLRGGEDPVTLDYGEFFNNLLTLVLVGLAMFLVIKMVNNLDDKMERLIGKDRDNKDQEPTNKKCPYCFETISYKATRCPHCTSELKDLKAR